MTYPQDFINKIIQGDCLEVMKQMPDKCVDLVITDPPYGIGAASKKFINGTSKTIKKYYLDNDWDTSIPSKEYFDEIFRVSKNQIIWGGNYFIEYLKNTRCFIVLDKTIHGNSYADCEMAWTSFDKVARIQAINIVETTNDGRVHPTQKPLKLMEWLIYNYSEPDALILDPFLGSGTTTRACLNLNRRFIGIEISPEYCKIANQRLKQQVLNF